MIIQSILLIITVVFFGVGMGSAPKSGPYISIPVRQQNCDHPSKPYETVRGILVNTELVTINNTVYGRGNVTVPVPKKRSNIFSRIHIYKMDDNHWQLVKKMDSHGCRGGMVIVTMKLIGMKYNKKWCSVEVGTYHYDHLDFNRLEHILWPSEREYGRFLWVLEFQTPSATIICYELENIVEPLKTPMVKKPKKRNQ